MLTAEENEKLTKVGAGTAMGNLLRRYWHPIAAATQLDENPVKRVRLLGAPLLPRWDMFVWDNVLRDIGFQEIPCNWLQMQENNVDPAHLQWLHGYFSNYVLERVGRPDLRRMAGRPQRAIHRWDLYENGIIK